MEVKKFLAVQVFWKRKKTEIAATTFENLNVSASFWNLSATIARGLLVFVVSCFGTTV